MLSVAVERCLYAHQSVEMRLSRAMKPSTLDWLLRCVHNRRHTTGKEPTAVSLVHPGSGDVVGSGVGEVQMVTGEPLSRPRSKGAKMRIKSHRWSFPKVIGPSCKHRLTVACPTATAHDRERGRARSPHRSQSAVFVLVDQGGGLPPGMVCA